ncbi:MAG: DUF885 domain-containing protein [Myxococcota bacterium]
MSRASTPRLPSGSRSPRTGWLRASLCTAILALAACKPPPPPPPPPEEPPPPPPTVERTGQEIFDAWFAAWPVYGTSMGDHRHDAAWPNVSMSGIEADRARIDAALASLEALKPHVQSVDDSVDFDMLRDELELQRFRHEVEQPWSRSPMWYAGIIGDGLEGLVSRDYAPVGQRAQALRQRLETLPALVDQAIANLSLGETTLPHTQVALGQLDGVQLLLQELPARLVGATEADLEGLEPAIAAASESVTTLRAHVDSLLPEANDQWRLGKENFQRKLALTLQTELSADEIRRMAIFEHAQIRQRMFTIASELAAVLFTPGRRRAIVRGSGTDPQTAITGAVLQVLSNNRVTPPDLRDRIESNLTRLDQFVRDESLVTLDDEEVLEVIWTPPHQRGVAIAGLAAPGPLDATKPGLPSFYLVQPVPDDWPDSYRDSFLREYNNFMLEILSIHEATPGHFVQLYYGKRDPSMIRKVLANGPFVEGWAVYAEQMMIDAGYGGAAPTEEAPPPGVEKKLWAVMQDPELRAKAIALHGLKFYLRTVTNAILDNSVHAGTMDELAGLELMVFRSFQQEGEAKAKWVRAQVTSTQLSTYFVGAQAWFKVREQAEATAAEAGETFDMQAFHDQALSHGAPPVHRLPELMAVPVEPEPEPFTDEVSSARPTQAPAVLAVSPRPASAG